MRLFRSLVPLLAALAALPGAAAAQAATLELDPGNRVVIAAPTLDARLIPATVTRHEPTWIAFRTEDGQEWTRHLHHVDRLRVRRPVPLAGRMRSGAAWGLFLGTSAGGIASPFIARGVEREMADWTAVGLSAGIGALTGTAVGALVGAVLPRSRWTEYRFQPAAAPR